jgi:hypothetical protein
MKLFIPATLDIDTLLTDNPPIEIKNFKKEYLIYFLHLISVIPATNKDIDTYNGYTPIHSATLQKKIRNYRAYIDYLLRCEIILTDNWHINGVKCKGYKYATRFSGTIKAADIDNKTLTRQIAKENELSPSIKKDYHHLIRWYDEKLTIDYDRALDFITDDLNEKLKNFRSRDFDAKTGEHKNPYHQFNSSLISIEKFAAESFSLFVDNNIYRFHSILTNIRSELRNYISYDDHPLVSIDVTNCQPFLSILLLNPSFWIDDNSSPGCVVTIKDVFPGYRSLLFDYYFIIDSFVMLCKSYEMQAESGFQRYKELVRKGQFYEYMKNEISARLNVGYADRKQLKEIMFQVLFTDNRFIAQTEAAPKRVFKELFPMVYDLFSKIKAGDKTRLPRLLQRIESHLMLLVIAKRIAKEKPGIPIFTIHDSIVTTVGNETYVEKVVSEELLKAVGFAPRLKIEQWNPENIENLKAGSLYGNEGTAA